MKKSDTVDTMNMCGETLEENTCMEGRIEANRCFVYSVNTQNKHLHPTAGEGQMECFRPGRHTSNLNP